MSADSTPMMLAAHQWYDRRGQTCSCGWDYVRGNGVTRFDQFVAHVAEALAPVLAARERLAAEAAIREHADTVGETMRAQFMALLNEQMDAHEERVLATIDETVRERMAQAWDEGRRAAGVMLPTHPPQYPTNPYRGDA